MKITEGLLIELVENGPYCDGDGWCSFCSFQPNDSEDLENVPAHKKTCLYRRAKEHVAAIRAEKKR